MTMPRSEEREVDPRRLESSRRRFLRNAGLLGASVPALGVLLDACASNGSSAGKALSGGGQGNDPYPKHPRYDFTLINHVTTNPFFVATRYGAQDACNLLGCTYDWVGSDSSDVSEMFNALNVAIDRRVAGIGIPIIDPVAFNSLTAKALDEGIPIIAYNASPPPGSANKALAYIGQDLFQSGVEAGRRVLKYVHKGDLVAGMIATPGSLNIQPRIDGAKSVLKPAGIDFVEVATGALPSQELTSVASWYLGHKDVKFLYAVDVGTGTAVGSAMQQYKLKSKGIYGSSYDLSTPVPTYVSEGILEFTIDQQPYLQGFLPILQLFLYQISGGLLHPADTNTGLVFVTKDNVKPYLANQDRYEGDSSTEKILTPPSAIKV